MFHLVITFTALMLLVGCLEQREGEVKENCNTSSIDVIFDIEAAKDSNLLFAATSSGIWVSNNGGHNWCPTSLERPDIEFLALIGIDTLFAASVDSGIWVSYDMGYQWTRTSFGTPSGISCLEAIFDSQLLVGTQHGDLYVPVYTGESIYWFKANNFGSFGWIEVIAYGAGSIYVDTGSDLYRSDDNGVSWTVLGNHNEGTKAIVIINKDSVVAANEFGLTLSTDQGIQWDFSKAERGYGMTVMRARSGPLYGAVNQLVPTLFRSDDSGGTWDSLTTIDDTFWTIVEDKHGDLHIGTRSGRFLKSTDGGHTWE